MLFGNNSKRIIFAIFFYFLIGSAFAKDLGTIGEVYPIEELDLRQVIQQRLLTLQQNGDLDKLNNKIQIEFQQQMDRPQSVAGLQRTYQARTWIFDPSVRIPYDLKNAKGDVVLPAGSIINPLDAVSLNETLLFYNADDPEQVRWVEQQDKQCKGKDKLILVDGSVASQMKLFKKQIFFDQGGRLTTRFEIKQVPAIVTQQGNHLKIQEIMP